MGASRKPRPAAAQRATHVDLPSELAAAQRLMSEGRALLAGPLLDHAVLMAPGQPEVHRLLAIQALLLDRPVDALAPAQRALHLAPERADLSMLLGRVHKARGDASLAIDAYREALRRDPRMVDAHVSLGIALKSAGRLSDAIACYREALAIDPDCAPAHANLGNALAEQIRRRPTADGEPSGKLGLDALRRAVAIDPGHVAARRNLGVALDRAGQVDDAIAELNAALGADPSQIESCLALCGCLSRAGMIEAMCAVYERWLSVNPAHAVAIANLATGLVELGRIGPAVDWCERGLQLAPGMPELMHNLGIALQQRLQVAEGIAWMQRALDEHPTYHDAASTMLMCMNYVNEDQETISAMHRRYAPRAIADALPPLVPTVPSPAPARRLRVGMVSADLRRHSVAYFIESFFAHHDRERIELFAYHNARQDDEVSERLRQHSAVWVPCRDLDDDQLARRIRDDRIDVLVDLSGHTAHARLPVFARRAAPLQMSYLGYPTTTGLDCIDHRISDATIDPPGQERHSSEAVLRLPAGMFCYRPDVEPDVGEPPSVAAGVVTFGSFNNLAKVGDATLRLWAAAMAAVPRSRLFVKTRALGDASVRDAMLHRLAQHGIAADRVLLNPWRPDLQSHLENYREVDIALDTFPYNGATTTCEALWMGVPVLTLCGQSHVARVGASILAAAGLQEWGAESPEQLVANAVALAADAEGRRSFRHDARRRLRASALFDAPRHARDLGELLLGAAMARADYAEPAAAVATAIAAA